jgi:hypothetical protein
VWTTFPAAARTAHADLANAYRDSAVEAVARFGDGRLGPAEGDEGRAALLDWLLVNGLLDPPAGGPVPPRRTAWDEWRDVEAAIVPPATTPAMTEGSGRDAPVFIRGSYKTTGEVVPRRFLEALAGPEQPAISAGSGRWELAQRLVDPSNPFVARVVVNRIWHHLFGRGIVPTVDNFGVLGEPPTHPELLDWLAERFVAEGWSIKRTTRLLALSRAYRMASRGSSRGDDVDPQVQLLHRMRVRRLEGEAIRDAILAVSGRLYPAMYGDGVEVHLTDFMEGRGRPAASGPLDGDGRRTVYLQVRRNFLNPMLLAFDAPLPFTTVGRRGQSNVPAQALILLNDPFVVEQAGVWARRVLEEAEPAPEARVGRMYLAAFGREPRPDEAAQAVDFVRRQSAAYGLPSDAPLDDPRPWSDLAHVLFNVKEFILID